MNALETFQRFSMLSGTLATMLGEDVDSILSKIEDLLDEKRYLRGRTENFRSKPRSLR